MLNGRRGLQVFMSFREALDNDMRDDKGLSHFHVLKENACHISSSSFFISKNSHHIENLKS